ncbi:hypothetical protein SERLADRAFT_401886 [Serpula lacrymans var. lacrymans S7.9]|uniref:Uncharacterized protein n=1 Tax=Serpula lacrymans var. lacrymans (strain S7.9) TaxID=578457 RepID=F8PB52_SERL9|nr:uncharacterized protein SERLADRAFT_401886 [Serpula lacrymans var. lacrymans S7.9]EGO19492.1 hypothetical protein SERLADRAFT_401886 [Serpula lacrymans var. lacrymans S7.9]
MQFTYYLEGVTPQRKGAKGHFLERHLKASFSDMLSHSTCDAIRPLVMKHDKLWLPDGGLVVEIENKLFFVDRSKLDSRSYLGMTEMKMQIYKTKMI